MLVSTNPFQLVHAGVGIGIAGDALRVVAQDQAEHCAVQRIQVSPAEAFAGRAAPSAPNPGAAAARQRPKCDALSHNEEDEDLFADYAREMDTKSLSSACGRQA
jgi:hypothetical protein